MVNKYKYLEFNEFLDLALRYALENSSHILYYCWRKDSALNFLLMLIVKLRGCQSHM